MLYKIRKKGSKNISGVSNIEKDKQKMERLYEERYNNQGCLMKIIQYNNRKNIVVEFQDNYKTKINTQYSTFLEGEIKNPYFPSVAQKGITGNKCPTSINGKTVKEYKAWVAMIRRSFDKNAKEKNSAYRDVICCEEWLLYENFYE